MDAFVCIHNKRMCKNFVQYTSELQRLREAFTGSRGSSVFIARSLVRARLYIYFNN